MGAIASVDSVVVVDVDVDVTAAADADPDGDNPGDSIGEAKQSAESTPTIGSERPDKDKVGPGMRCCAAAGAMTVMAAAGRRTRCLHVRAGKTKLSCRARVREKSGSTPLGNEAELTGT